MKKIEENTKKITMFDCLKEPEVPLSVSLVNTLPDVLNTFACYISLNIGGDLMNWVVIWTHCLKLARFISTLNKRLLESDD